MKIISYNLNGIRAAFKKGLAEWVAENPADILCFQETKAQPDQVPEEKDPLVEMGYHRVWHSAQKKGYSGVATYSKTPIDNAVIGSGIEVIDFEGRILRTDHGDTTILNCYFPSGTSGDHRQAFKMDYLDQFFEFAQNLKKERPKLIILGDYNIAHTENDIHNPKGNAKNSGFLPEERDWMTKWFDSGFHDSFRLVHPEKTEYSWWTYRANARANNKGWRIDYLSVSDALKDSVVSVEHRKDAVHSDHCPVEVGFEK